MYVKGEDTLFEIDSLLKCLTLHFASNGDMIFTIIPSPYLISDYPKTRILRLVFDQGLYQYVSELFR